MSQHTPGPWNVARSRDGAGWKGIAVQDAERLFIANMVMQPGTENEIANARLIAAAPDLLAACEAAIRYDESIAGRAVRGEYNLREAGGGMASGDDLDVLYAAWIDSARAAIRKVEGQ